VSVAQKGNHTCQTWAYWGHSYCAAAAIGWHQHMQPTGSKRRHLSGPGHRDSAYQ